jgi:hypothetical protein
MNNFIDNLKYSKGVPSEGTIGYMHVRFYVGGVQTQYADKIVFGRYNVEKVVSGKRHVIKQIGTSVLYNLRSPNSTKYDNPEIIGYFFVHEQSPELERLLDIAKQNN